MNVPIIIAATGVAFYVIAYGLIIQKSKETPKNSYFIHYLSPLIFLILGFFLFSTGLSLNY